MLWGPQGGQPPGGPSRSVQGTYIHSRYSTQSFPSCAAAEAAMSDANTLPFRKADNQKPTIYLGSSLGSAFFVFDEPTFTVTITDPDGDEFHATVTVFGRPPEECNWPQVCRRSPGPPCPAAALLHARARSLGPAPCRALPIMESSSRGATVAP